MNRANIAARTPAWRARRIIVGAIALVMLTHAVASADAAPVLEATFPLPNGTARTVDAGVIWARFDRTLQDETSDIRLFDNGSGGSCNAPGVPVAGEDYLSEPPSHLPGGLRQLNFQPFSPLTETCSPYTATGDAHSAVTVGEAEFTWSFTIDNTAPGAPAVTDPLSGQTRTDQPLVVRGTGEPGARVLVIENTTLIAEDVVASDAQFVVFLPYPPEDGVFHTFEVFQRDPAGNTSPGTGPITIYHDSILQLPVIRGPTEGTCINSTTVTVSGTAKPGSTVRVREGGPIVGVTTADGDGEWTVDIVFGAGPHSITAESFDGVMTDGPSAARAFVVDLTPPAAPVVTTPPAASMIGTPDVTISGTAEPGGRVRVRHLGIIRADVPVDPAGSWTTTLDFTEGAQTIEVWALDCAGNPGPSAFRSFTVDTAAPPAPVITQPVQNAFVNVNNVTIAGDAEPGAMVRVLVGTAVVGTSFANGGGSWSVNVFFADGAHSVTARAVDGAGNAGPESPPRSFTVDTEAPAAPVIEFPQEASAQTTNPVTVSGSGEPAATIEVREGVVVAGTAVADAHGNWDVQISFTNGPHAITARAIDLAGNIGPSSPLRSFTVNVTIDIVPPPTPILVDPPAMSLQPGHVVFRGTAEAGSTVRIREGSVVIAHGTAATGTFTLSATMPSGSHTVTATAADTSGNVSAPTAPRQFTVDATRPGISVDTANGSIFLPAQPVLIEGTASDNTGVIQIELEVRTLLGDLVTTEIASGCSGCPGSPVAWEDELSLTPGIYDVSAYARDVVGNRSRPASLYIVVLQPL